MNKKGFFMMETLAVIVFVAGIFTFIYISILPLMGTYNDLIVRENDIDIVYKLYNIRSAIQKDNKIDLEGETFIQLQCSNFRDADYCNNLMLQMDLATKNNSNNIVPNYLLYYTSSIKDNINSFTNTEIKTYLDKHKDETNPTLILMDTNKKTIAHLDYFRNTEPTVLGEIKKRVDKTNTVINFANNSSNTNGKGIYVLKGTESDEHPIYYYRGEVDNNNVIFGGFCWKMIRTTDTGGIKMIYNGSPKKGFIVNTDTINDSNINYTNDGSYPYAYDSDTKQWKSTNHANKSTGTIIFNFKNAGNYAIKYRVSSEAGSDIAKIYRGDTLLIQDSGSNTETIELENVNTSENIKIEYTKDGSVSNGDDNVVFELGKITGKQETDNVCNSNTLDEKIIGKSKFNSHYKSMAGFGYMYNEEYLTSSAKAADNSVFGKSVEWNGISYLVIEDTPGVASTNTTRDDYHHYSCGTATDGIGDTSCNNIRYYFFSSYYLTLSNGEKIEDALYKMTGTGTSEVKLRNSDYTLNVNDSEMKTTIENWFKTNLTNEEDGSKINYQLYLEDTIFCNDRSFKTVTGNSIYPTYNQSSWNPNGGNDDLSFGVYNRSHNSWYSATNVPVLTCSNETDRFSVSNPKAKLKYPVGLITLDELILAGAGGNWSNTCINTTYYLHGYGYYWTMSPGTFGNYIQHPYLLAPGSGICYTDNSGTTAHSGSSRGVRPVISLKSDTSFEQGGNGTPTNPYIVRYD